MKIYINGRFLTQHITGVQRYALEMTKAMDAIIGQDEDLEKNEYILLSPQNILYKPELKNISVLTKGIFSGYMWEQFELPIYTREGFLLNFCNCAPLVKRNQAVTIHDAAVCAMPNSFSYAFRTWYRVMFLVLGKMARRIYTVSEFSKKEINRYFNIPLYKIGITYNGIDHVKKIQADENVLRKNNLQNKKYVLAVSSLNPSKNFSLVLQMARQMPDVDFVIAGGSNANVFNNHGFTMPPSNVNFVGYVTDEELMALYKNASVFVYPSMYEGFGIPPLEAMVWNCPVVVSDIEVFHEVYGDAVYYCPYNNISKWIDILENTLHGLDKKGSHTVKKLLEKYRWQEAGMRITANLS